MRVADNIETAYGGTLYNNDFTFSPSKLTANLGFNEFNDWATMFLIIQTEKIATPDIALTENFTVPPGVWNLRKGSLLHDSIQGGQIILTIPNGATIDNCAVVGRSLAVVTTKTVGDAFTFTDINYLSGQPFVMLIDLGASINNQGTVPAITIPDTGFFVLAVRQSNFRGLSPALTAPVVSFANTGSIVAVLEGTGVPLNGFPDEWLSGNASVVLQYSAGCDFFRPVLSSFTGLEFTIPASYIENAQYTPANSLDWAGDPSNAKQALDRVAAQVAALSGFPIP